MSPSSDPVTVSAVVLNFNGASLLAECLDSLKAQNWPPLELLVVDNGSTDDSAVVCAAHGARFLALEDNLGYSRANNRGAVAARGSLLLFLNNDTRLERDAVRWLAELLSAEPDVFVADPQVLDWDGTRTIHHALRFGAGPFFRSVLPGIELQPVASRRLEVPWGCGSSLMVRRSMFEALGGFDDTFFFDWEDADLCWRGWLRGWRTVYVPEARVYHRVGATFREVYRDREQDWTSLRARDGQKNYLRWAFKVMPADLVAKVVAREMLRVVKSLVLGQWRFAGIQARNLLRTFGRMPELLALRRELRAVAVTDSASLIRSFMDSRSAA